MGVPLPPRPGDGSFRSVRSVESTRSNYSANTLGPAQAQGFPLRGNGPVPFDNIELSQRQAQMQMEGQGARPGLVTQTNSSFRWTQGAGRGAPVQMQSSMRGMQGSGRASLLQGTGRGAPMQMNSSFRAPNGSGRGPSMQGTGRGIQMQMMSRGPLMHTMGNLVSHLE